MSVAAWLAPLQRHARTLLDMALPAMCPGCGERLQAIEQVVCATCLDHIEPPRRPLCPVCGRGERNLAKRCPSCLPSGAHFGSARQAALWIEPMPTLIHALKYRAVAELADPLAALVDQLIEREMPGEAWDLIVPVPLHRVRQRERGYNQSTLLARALSRRRGWPVAEDLVARHRWTKTQTHLGRAERLTNVEGAFRCADPLGAEGRRVLLIDDVYTTGATTNETARALADAGASEITAVAVARADQ